jgi:S-adenosylmethionine hydrolase
VSDQKKQPITQEVWFVADYDAQSFSEAEGALFEELCRLGTDLPRQVKRVKVPEFDTYSCGYLLYQLFSRRSNCENAYVLCNVHPRFPQDTNREEGSRFLIVKLTNGIHILSNDCGYNLSLLHQEKIVNKWAIADIEQFGFIHTQFHGRDSYMPLMGKLLDGEVGDQDFDWQVPDRLEGVNYLDEGKCMYIDNYGNCKIYAQESWLGEHNSVQFKQYIIPVVKKIGDDIQGVRCVVGSSGPVVDGKGTWLELQVLGGNASKILGMREGDRVKPIKWEE